MAIAKDASSPANKTQTTTAALVTASFTPPAGSLIVAACVTGNSSSGVQSGTISDSLSGSWATDKTSNTSGSGMVAVVRRTTATSGAAMTVTWTPSGTTGKGTQITVTVLTGASASPLGHNAGATNAGNASLTPTGAGNYVVGCVCSNPAGVALAMQGGCTADLSTNDATNGETYGTFHLSALTVSTTPITVGYTNSLAAGQFAAVEYLADAGSSINVSDTITITESVSVVVSALPISPWTPTVQVRPRIFAPGIAR